MESAVYISPDDLSSFRRSIAVGAPGASKPRDGIDAEKDALVAAHVVGDGIPTPLARAVVYHDWAWRDSVNAFDPYRGSGGVQTVTLRLPNGQRHTFLLRPSAADCSALTATAIQPDFNVDGVELRMLDSVRADCQGRILEITVVGPPSPSVSGSTSSRAPDQSDALIAVRCHSHVAILQLNVELSDFIVSNDHVSKTSDRRKREIEKRVAKAKLIAARATAPLGSPVTVSLFLVHILAFEPLDRPVSLCWGPQDGLQADEPPPPVLVKPSRPPRPSSTAAAVTAVLAEQAKAKAAKAKPRKKGALAFDKVMKMEGIEVTKRVRAPSAPKPPRTGRGRKPRPVGRPRKSPVLPTADSTPLDMALTGTGGAAPAPGGSVRATAPTAAGGVADTATRLATYPLQLLIATESKRIYTWAERGPFDTWRSSTYSRSAAMFSHPLLVADLRQYLAALKGGAGDGTVGSGQASNGAGAADGHAAAGSIQRPPGFTAISPTDSAVLHRLYGLQDHQLPAAPVAPIAKGLPDSAMTHERWMFVGTLHNDPAVLKAGKRQKHVSMTGVEAMLGPFRYLVADHRQVFIVAIQLPPTRLPAYIERQRIVRQRRQEQQAEKFGSNKATGTAVEQDGSDDDDHGSGSGSGSSSSGEDSSEGGSDESHSNSDGTTSGSSSGDDGDSGSGDRSDSEDGKDASTVNRAKQPAGNGKDDGAGDGAGASSGAAGAVGAPGSSGTGSSNGGQGQPGQPGTKPGRADLFMDVSLIPLLDLATAPPPLSWCEGLGEDPALVAASENIYAISAVTAVLRPRPEEQPLSSGTKHVLRRLVVVVTRSRLMLLDTARPMVPIVQQTHPMTAHPLRTLSVDWVQVGSGAVRPGLGHDGVSSSGYTPMGTLHIYATTSHPSHVGTTLHVPVNIAACVAGAEVAAATIAKGSSSGAGARRGRTGARAGAVSAAPPAAAPVVLIRALASRPLPLGLLKTLPACFPSSALSCGTVVLPCRRPHGPSGSSNDGPAALVLLVADTSGGLSAYCTARTAVSEGRGGSGSVDLPQSLPVTIVLYRRSDGATAPVFTIKKTLQTAMARMLSRFARSSSAVPQATASALLLVKDAAGQDGKAAGADQDMEDSDEEQEADVDQRREDNTGPDATTPSMPPLDPCLDVQLHDHEWLRGAKKRSAARPTTYIRKGLGSRGANLGAHLAGGPASEAASAAKRDDIHNDDDVMSLDEAGPGNPSAPTAGHAAVTADKPRLRNVNDELRRRGLIVQSPLLPWDQYLAFLPHSSDAVSAAVTAGEDVGAMDLNRPLADLVRDEFNRKLLLPTVMGRIKALDRETAALAALSFPQLQASARSYGVAHGLLAPRPRKVKGGADGTGADAVDGQDNEEDSDTDDDMDAATVKEGPPVLSATAAASNGSGTAGPDDSPLDGVPAHLLVSGESWQGVKAMTGQIQGLADQDAADVPRADGALTTVDEGNQPEVTGIEAYRQQLAAQAPLGQAPHTLTIPFVASALGITSITSSSKGLRPLKHVRPGALPLLPGRPGLDTAVAAAPLLQRLMLARIRANHPLREQLVKQHISLHRLKRTIANVISPSGHVDGYPWRHELAAVLGAPVSWPIRHAVTAAAAVAKQIRNGLYAGPAVADAKDKDGEPVPHAVRVATSSLLCRRRELHDPQVDNVASRSFQLWSDWNPRHNKKAQSYGYGSDTGGDDDDEDGGTFDALKAGTDGGHAWQSAAHRKRQAQISTLIRMSRATAAEGACHDENSDVDDDEMDSGDDGRARAGRHKGGASSEVAASSSLVAKYLLLSQDNFLTALRHPSTLRSLTLRLRELLEDPTVGEEAVAEAMATLVAQKRAKLVRLPRPSSGTRVHEVAHTPAHLQAEARSPTSGGHAGKSGSALACLLARAAGEKSTLQVSLEGCTCEDDAVIPCASPCCVIPYTLLYMRSEGSPPYADTGAVAEPGNAGAGVGSSSSTPVLVSRLVKGDDNMYPTRLADGRLPPLHPSARRPDKPLPAVPFRFGFAPLDGFIQTQRTGRQLLSVDGAGAGTGAEGQQSDSNDGAAGNDDDTGSAGDGVDLAQLLGVSQSQSQSQSQALAQSQASRGHSSRGAAMDDGEEEDEEDERAYDTSLPAPASNARLFGRDVYPSSATAYIQGRLDTFEMGRSGWHEGTTWRAGKKTLERLVQIADAGQGRYGWSSRSGAAPGSAPLLPFSHPSSRVDDSMMARLEEQWKAGLTLQTEQDEHMGAGAGAGAGSSGGAMTGPRGVGSGTGLKSSIKSSLGASRPLYDDDDIDGHGDLYGSGAYYDQELEDIAGYGPGAGAGAGASAAGAGSSGRAGAGDGAGSAAADASSTKESQKQNVSRSSLQEEDDEDDEDDADSFSRLLGLPWGLRKAGKR